MSSLSLHLTPSMKVFQIEMSKVKGPSKTQLWTLDTKQSRTNPHFQLFVYNLQVRQANNGSINSPKTPPEASHGQQFASHNPKTNVEFYSSERISFHIFPEFEHFQKSPCQQKSWQQFKSQQQQNKQQCPKQSQFRKVREPKAKTAKFIR